MDEPYAGVGTPVGTPPPPPSAGADPYAGVGTAVAPAAAPASVTANPKGEGVYHMQGPSGMTAIPFSNVEPARQQGYYFDKSVLNPGVDEEARYTKDKNYSGIDRVLGTPSAGAVKSAVQVPNTLVGWLDSITDKAAHTVGIKNPEQSDLRPHLEKAEETVAPGVTAPLHGAGEHVGGFAETIAEWLFGEGEARATYEALSQSQKMAKVAQAAKFIEEHPALAASLRTAAVAAGSGGQAAAHGATPGEAGESALLGGGAGGLGELLTGGAGAARAAEATRRTTQTALDELPRARQAVAQTQIHNVAKQATQDALERLNATRGPVTVETPIRRATAALPARSGAETIDQGITAANAKAQLGSTAATVPTRLMPQNPIVSELGPQAALVPDRIWGEIPASDGIHAETQASPNFAHIDAAKESADVGSFGDAAEKIRAAAQPVYQQLNSATGGKFNKLRIARTAAYKSGNVTARREAEMGIEKLLAEKPKGVSAEDYATAKSAWADTKTLDRLHEAVEGSFNGISEEIAAQPGTGERSLRSGPTQGTLQTNLGRLLRSRDMPAKIEQLIGKEGIANLYRASNLVSTPEIAKATAALAEQVAGRFPNLHKVVGGSVGAAAGTAVGHAVAGNVGAAAGSILGAAAGGALSDGARNVMRKMVMSPRVGQLMDFAVRNNVSPKIAAAAVAAEIQREQGEQGGGTK